MAEASPKLLQRLLRAPGPEGRRLAAEAAAARALAGSGRVLVAAAVIAALWLARADLERRLRSTKHLGAREVESMRQSDFKKDRVTLMEAVSLLLKEEESQEVRLDSNSKLTLQNAVKTLEDNKIWDASLEGTLQELVETLSNMIDERAANVLETEVELSDLKVLRVDHFGEEMASVMRKDRAVRQISLLELPSVNSMNGRMAVLPQVLARHELDQWKSLSGKHEGIAKFYGTCCDTKTRTTLLVMEHAPLTMDELLQESQNVRLSYEYKEHAILGVSKGLQWLHDQGIIHHDVRPSNIILDQRGLHVRLRWSGAFMSLLRAHATTSTECLIGKWPYLAPEVLRGDLPSKASDVFSLALTSWEILFQKQPWGSAFVREEIENFAASKGKQKRRPNFHGKDMVEELNVEGNAFDRPKLKVNVNEKLQQLLEKSWAEDPLKRPSSFEFSVVMEARVISHEKKRLSSRMLKNLLGAVKKCENNFAKLRRRLSSIRGGWHSIPEEHLAVSKLVEELRQNPNVEILKEFNEYISSDSFEIRKEDFKISRCREFAWTRGVIPVLLEMGRNCHDSNEAEPVCKALRFAIRVYDDHVLHEFIGLHNGHLVIVDLMRRFVDYPDATQWLAQAMLSMSYKLGYATKLIAEGAADAFLEAMRKHPDHALMQQRCCGAIRNFSFKKVDTISMVEKDVVPLVLEALKQHPSHIMVQREGLAALWNTSAYDGGAAIIVQQAGPRQIATCLHSHRDNPDVHQEGCGALSNLAIDPGVRKDFIDMNVADDLLFTMRRFREHAGLQSSALYALSSLSLDDDMSINLVLNKQASSDVLEAMQRHRFDARVQFNGLFALTDMSVQPQPRELMVAQSCFDYVLAAVRTHENDPRVQGIGMAAIHNFGTHLKALLRLGVHKDVLRALHVFVEERLLVRDGLRALQTLLFRSAGLENLVRKAGGKEIVSRCHDMHPEDLRIRDLKKAILRTLQTQHRQRPRKPPSENSFAPIPGHTTNRFTNPSMEDLL